jgi:hypothetical protein
MIQLLRRYPVSTRTSILALAAVATVATAALASTAASAKPMGVIIKKPIVTGLVLPPSKPVLGVVIHPPGLVLPPHPIMGVVIHHPDHDDDEPHFWWHHYHRPWIVEQSTPMPVSTPMSVSTPVTTAPTAPCNCLTKNYLTDGGVLFKDVCTKEAAVASPDELKAQMQGARP